MISIVCHPELDSELDSGSGKCIVWYFPGIFLEPGRTEIEKQSQPINK